MLTSHDQEDGKRDTWGQQHHAYCGPQKQFLFICNAYASVTNDATELSQITNIPDTE